MRPRSDDPHRVYTNAQTSAYDWVWWCSTAATQAIFLASRTTQRWPPGTLLLGLSHVALTSLLAWLVVQRRPFYVRYREVLTTLGTLHYSILDMHAALHAEASPVAFHGGSALRLLALLSCSTPTLFLLLIALYGRLAVSWSAIAQPLLALHPLLMSRHTCQRVLESAGTAPLLAQLHETLGFVHSAPLMAHVAASSHGTDADPMRDCLAVSNYLTVMLVVVLPLALLRLNERRSRAHFASMQRQPQEHQLSGSSGDSWLDEPQRSQGRRGRRHGEGAQPTVMLWCFQLYLQSCCCWAFICLALRLPLPWLRGAAGA